jgi:hypothetical protein
MPLAETLAMIGQAAGVAADPWWIIGSAAVVLHGGAVPDVKDVDLMMSGRDAEALIRRVSGELRKTRTIVSDLWSSASLTSLRSALKCLAVSASLSPENGVNCYCLRASR